MAINLSPQEKAFYKDILFPAADADKDGKIGIQDAAFFRNANPKLADPVLGKIWQLVDTTGKAFLTENEFYVALRLIAAAQQGKDPVISLASESGPKLASFNGFTEPKAPVGAAADPWVILAQDRAKFTEYFKTADTDKDGFVTGMEARDLFSKSGLDVSDLAKIWRLSDVTADSKLDCDEFVIAMFLINCRRKGMQIPDVLPQSLIPVSGSTTSPVATPNSSTTSLPHATPTPKADNNTPYKISSEEKQKYTEIFKRADSKNEKFISGDQARQMFGRSGLPVPDLGKIWNLSDTDKDGKLSEPEFVIAMWLIYAKLRGVDIPDTLPESLKQDAGLTTAAPVDTKAGPPKKVVGNFDIKLDDIVPPTTTAPLNPLSNVPALPPSTGVNIVPGMGVVPPGASFSGSSLPGMNPNMTVAPIMPTPTMIPTGMNSTQKQDLLKQFEQERTSNAELEKEVHNEQRVLDTSVVELRELEQKVAEEKAKGVALKEQLKYIRFQIKSVKEQKEQFEKILKEKNEQFQEEQDIYNLLEHELKDKQTELQQLQNEITNVSSGSDSLRAKRKEAKEQLSTIKSQFDTVQQQSKSVTASPVVTTNSATASPSQATAKKEPPPIPTKKETTTGFSGNPFPADAFGSGFGTSSFDSSDAFGTPFEPFANTNTANTGNTKAPSVPPKPKKAEDPFSFSSDLTAKDSFGGNPTDNSFGFNDNFGFSDNFGSDSFGAPTKTAAPPVPAKTKPAVQESFDHAFNAFPNNLAEFDTGKDSFG